MVRHVTLPRPSPFDYQDFRKYLEAWFEAKPLRPSQGQFADRIGISRAMMSQILKGKRVLQEEYIPAFVEQLRLGENDAAYFAALVGYTQARDELQRQFFIDQMMHLQRERGRRQVAEDARQLFSTWYGIALIQLAGCEGFRPDPEWIAQTMVPRITVEQAREALALLTKLTSSQPDGADPRYETNYEIDEPLTPADASELWEKVDDDRTRNRMLYQMHTEMLDHAARALDDMPPQEREFNVLTIAIPEYYLPTLKREVRGFMERTWNRSRVAPGARTRVYQLNVQLFPLTQWSDRALVDPCGGAEGEDEAGEE